MSKHKIVSKENLLPFILVASLFFMWALPSNLNDILIPQFMKSFELNRLQAGLVQSAFYLGYFLLAMPAAYIMDRYNYKTGLIIGLLLFATGCYLFWPAAVFGKYELFLMALFVIATGLAFLETGANSFVAVLGDPDTSAQRLNFAQSFYPLGAISGVLVGNIFIFSGIEHTDTQIEALKVAGTYKQYLNDEIMRVIPPYMVVGAVILVWAFLIWKVKFPAELETGTKSKIDSKNNDSHGHLSKLFKYPHFVKGVITQFFYIGAQVGTWSYLIPYVKDYLQKPEKEAGYFLLASMILFAIGRVLSTIIMRKVEPKLLMGIYSIINIALVIIAMTMSASIGGYALVVSSFFMSLMFPTIFASGLKGLGPNTKIGASMLVMAIIGGAVWTPIMGLISDKFDSLSLAMIIPLIGYVMVSVYAFKGSKPMGPLYDSDEKIVAGH